MPQVASIGSQTNFFLFCLLLVVATSSAFLLSRSGRSGRPKSDVFCDSFANYPEFEPNRPGFFDNQLDICRSIIAEDRNSSYNIILEDDLVSAPQRRRRFKEHPRSTARFGEVLLHARDHACSKDEYKFAVYNAQSVVDYVETKLIESNNSLPVRNGLVDDVASSLTTTSLYKFRKLQLEIDRSGSDFTLEQYDLELIGRLYYSAIRRVEPYLAEVGLSCDHTGFTALLALCRAAASDSTNLSSTTSYRSLLPTLSKAGERLDAALSNHFNAITVPGCRFFFSPHHGLGPPRRSRSKHLIIAFSSLGNGIVRHEFGGSLAKMNNDVNGGCFDVLFVADPAQSWYQKDDRGGLNGFAQYSHRIKVASKSYKHISLIGDSMGGSGAMLFAHLATNTVVAFSPQVDLIEDDHVSRDDMTPLVRQMFQSRLFESAEEAIGKGVKLFIHRGLESSDAHQTDLLMGRLSPLGTENIKVIVHSSCDHHQIAMYMKQKGQLLNVLLDCLNTCDHSKILR